MIRMTSKKLGPVAGLSRRGLLHFGAAFSLVVFARSAPALASPPRTLHLVNQNTGETFNGVYAENDRYVPEASEQLSRLMRDHNIGEMCDMDPRLFDIIHDLGVSLNHEGPIYLVSGYRSPRTNAQMRRRSRRVARNSYHMGGQAADVIVPGRTVAQMRRAAIDLGAGGVGTYRRQRFLHVDTGPVRVW